MGGSWRSTPGGTGDVASPVGHAGLDEYHRRLDYARQVKQQYADQLIIREDGEADWERTTEGLKACEQLDPLLRVFPELKEILVDPSRSIRMPYAVHWICWRGVPGVPESLSRVAQFIDLGSVLGSEGKQSKMSANDFADWLERQSQGSKPNSPPWDPSPCC